MKESAFIHRLLAASSPCAELPVGPGDDAAVLPGGLVVTVDTIVEGTHFLAADDIALVARKAVGVSASDCAAMGAAPWLVFHAVQAPPGIDAERLADALAHWSTAFGLTVAGGDTVTSPTLALTTTVIGRLEGAAPWLRSGARPGDAILVSGPLGGSRGGRHLRVTPRRDAVTQLRAAGVPVHASLDLSDGLARDLPRITEASGVGARIDAAAIPVHPDVPRGRNPLTAALGDGEDFELLVTIPADVDPTRLGTGWTRIGAITEGRDVVLVRDGVDEPWPQGGYEHDL